MVLSDGGPEFKGHFERGLEHLGVFQHVIDAESPWENGRSLREQSHHYPIRVRIPSPPGRGSQEPLPPQRRLHAFSTRLRGQPKTAQ
eukprot:6649812-Pyramimonas_sp.AAC.1